jgi:hypothetical protein
MVKNLNEKPAYCRFLTNINFPADEAKLARPVLKIQSLPLRASLNEHSNLEGNFK